MRLLPVLAAAATLTAVALPAAAVETVGDFQLYVLGNMNGSGNNYGRTAVGGNASYTNGTSFGGATSANPSSLVVGGDLTYNSNGGSIGGQALVGGANHALPYMSVASGVTLPVDFTVENLRLKNLSATLAQTAATGTSAIQWGGLQLNGSNADLNVFSLTSDQLSGVNWTGGSIASGSQILINVSGTNVNLGGGLYFQNASNIIWNFYQATSITAGGLSLSGTVLAPLATFQGNGGSIDGDLIVGNFNGGISLYGGGYGGGLLTPAVVTTPPVIDPPVVTPTDPIITPPDNGVGIGNPMAVPEPGTWALMILGFGAVGAMLRRRRTLDAATHA